MTRLAFIIGVGRSGSSILHELLGYHPRVGWMSRLCEAYPEEPHRNRRALSAMRLPIVGPLLRRSYEPRECYRFFDTHYPGFSAPARDLRASDLTDRAAAAIRETLPRVTASPRDTLVVKLTGWPRIGFLAGLFPEARFIHLMRDGRAVTNSLLQVPWWHGWGGPDNWRFGPLPDRYAATWEAHERSFVALAALEWRLIIDAVDGSRGQLPPDRLLDVRYEDLCEEPDGAMSTILDHLGLDRSRELERAMRRDPMRNRNAKWRTELGERNADIATDVLRDLLPRHGYAV